MKVAASHGKINHSSIQQDMLNLFLRVQPYEIKVAKKYKDCLNVLNYNSIVMSGLDRKEIERNQQ